MASHTFTPFDEADFLKTEEDIAAYLAVVAEDGDPEEVVAALAAVARARNMSALARDVGLTRVGLYKALAPNGNPGFGTVAKVARALGYGFSFVPIESGPQVDKMRGGGQRSGGGPLDGRNIGVRTALSTGRGGMGSSRGAVGEYTMATGKKPASKASGELSSKTSTKGEKTVAASALAQAPRKGGGAKGGSKKK